MTAFTHLKGVLAGLAALAIAGAALAQSTPPNPAAKDPAVGAGQQSTQATPMGATGTSGGSTGTGTAAGSTGSSSSGSTMGASGSPAASADTGTAASSRTAKADRN